MTAADDVGEGAAEELVRAVCGAFSWQLIVTTRLLMIDSMSCRTSSASRAGKAVRKQPPTLSVSAEVIFLIDNIGSTCCQSWLWSTSGVQRARLLLASS